MSLVAFRTTLSASRLPAGIEHIDYLVQRNGHLVDANALNPMQKLLYRNCEMVTILTGQQRLVFRHSLNVHGLRVDAKLTMLVSPDRRSPRAFLSSFYRQGSTQITSGALIVALRPHVQAAIAENLAFVDVTSFSNGSAIKNATRHNKLAAICEVKGLKLFTDTLVLEGVI